MRLPYKILVVEDDENARAGIVELLLESGYDVVGESTYEAAKQRLAEDTFDLMITDVRLRSFNGLHLVMHCRIDRPDTSIIIMTGYDDSLMEIEAARYNARFVRKPIKPAEFLNTVTLALSGVRRQRRWPRKRIEGGFRVTAAGYPAAVVDVSYGGLRFEMPGGPIALPPAFDIEISGIGLQLRVEPVWSYPARDGGPFVCGAALGRNTAPTADTWRAIVDRLN